MTNFPAPYGGDKELTIFRVGRSLLFAACDVGQNNHIEAAIAAMKERFGQTVAVSVCMALSGVSAEGIEPIKLIALELSTTGELTREKIMERLMANAN